MEWTMEIRIFTVGELAAYPYTGKQREPKALLRESLAIEVLPVVRKEIISKINNNNKKGVGNE